MARAERRFGFLAALAAVLCSLGGCERRPRPRDDHVVDVARPEAAAAPAPEHTAPASGSALTPEDLDEARAQLQRLFEDSDDPEHVGIGRELVHTSRWLPALYDRRGYALAWFSREGPRPEVGELVAAIEAAHEHGLRPEDYHLGALRARREALAAARTPEARPHALAEMEALLSDAFLMLGEHLLAGRVDPATVHPDWLANRREADLTLLFESVFGASPDVPRRSLADALASLPPPHPGYTRLQSALARYRALAARGGWPVIPEGAPLAPGDAGPRVAAVRARLHATGELAASAHDSEPPVPTFDEPLARAVRRFQARHGLPETGQVDPGTRAAMNVSAERRAAQIALALERWRWLPHELGARHLLVNVANFELDLVEDGHVVEVRRVVVGRAYRRTPSLSSRVSHIVLNPSWTVPRTIAVQDLLPEARRNPAALARRGLRVYARGDLTREVPIQSVPWKKLSANHFPYVLRQDAGPQNALGRMKFMFPNPYQVYLHDTPLRDLFRHTTRDFSSGCIRVEKPQVLAEWLLRETPRWSAEAVHRALGSSKEQTVWLATPVPVHLAYWTAFADDEGEVQFRPDIYQRDAELERALGAPAPTP